MRVRGRAVCRVALCGLITHAYCSFCVRGRLRVLNTSCFTLVHARVGDGGPAPPTLKPILKRLC